MSLLERWREWRESRAEHAAAAEEMRFHIEQEIEHNMRLGLSPQRARREALRAFGGVDRFAEEARDARTGTKLSDFAVSWLDWKLGFRMLAKYPGLSLIGGVTLAGAIGLGAGLFEASMMEYSPRLPFEDGDRIVRIDNWDAAAARPGPRSLHDFVTWREQLASVEQLGAHRSFDRNLITPDGRSSPVHVAEISASAFSVTRVPALMGRTFTDADADGDVVLIGYDVWRDRFHGESDIINRTIRLGRSTATVIGVMPEGFAFPRSHQAWVPLRVGNALPGEGPGIGVFGRLADGATVASAQAELSALGTRMSAAQPSTHAQLRPVVLRFAADASFRWRDLFLVNLLAWAVLGAACANVATLMFARTAMRESEIVVRNALGASRARVMGQLFVEALVLALTAAVVGLAGATFVLNLLVRTVAENGSQVPFWWDARLEPATMLYTAVLAVAGAALVGLLPAVKATGARVQAGLTKMAAGGTNLQFGGVWSVIIVLQVAFTVICLPIALSSSREAIRDVRTRAAFPADEYLTFQPELDREAALSTLGELSEDEFRTHTLRVFDELTRRLESEPGIDVTFASALPGTSHPWRYMEAQRGTDVPFAVNANLSRRVLTAEVDTGFFTTFRVPLRAGRAFRAGDVGSAYGVVLINESLARNVGGNPLGVRLRYTARTEDDEPGPWYEVIGVVRNLNTEPTNRGEADFMYLPASAADAYPPAVAVRVTGDAESFVPRLRTLAMQVEPGLRLYDLMPLDEVIRRRDLPFIQAHLAGIGVVLLAITLSAAGLYALMSVAVARRTREIAIRVAMGASRRAVLAAIFNRAAMQVGAGLIVGNLVVGAVLIGNLGADEMLYMLGISAVMALVGVLACLVPALRALRIEPTVALKQAQ